MFVSVVIATRNRRALLARTLAALGRQSWPAERFEIVVADNGSTDDTRTMVDELAATRSSPAIRYLLVDRPGKSFAVNAALQQARGDIVLLTDDDVQPSGVWIERLVGAMERHRADFAAGRILPNWEVEAPAWLTPSLYGVLAVADNGLYPLPIARGLNEHVMPIGANMGVRAAVLRQIGGLRTDLGKLDGSLRTGEDHEFFLRLLHAGCRGVYEPEAVVAHFVPAARLERGYFRRWLYQNGRDVARLEAAYPDGVTRLLGVPRYLWRKAAGDAGAWLAALARRDRASSFASRLRLIWFAGYVRDAWLGERVAGPILPTLVEEHR